MRYHLQALLRRAISQAQEDGALKLPSWPDIRIERSRNNQHGDFASPVALGLARVCGQHPRNLAQQLLTRLPPSNKIESATVAGPGFINFFMTPRAFQEEIPEILAQGDRYGQSDLGQGQSIQVEFVSANPTGPLHIGHGRGAAYGASVATLLEAIGYTVQREYYVNDAGRQMDILATSVWLRYLELCGEQVPFPSAGYRGDYIWDIAATLHREQKDTYRAPGQAATDAVASFADNAEAQIDALVATTKALLGDKRYRAVLDRALSVLLDDIQGDLEHFGVHFDRWYHERHLVESSAVDQTVQSLTDTGHVYEQDGALWFRSTAFGDEKDRVLVRENGQTTYFASDVAYHLGKLQRGFQQLIDIWGADHHGYVARLKAALQALGKQPSQLAVLLVQFVSLFRGKERIPMSTRSGEFITLRQLRKEVGKDAARFFFVMRKHDQHLDFDLDLAKSQSADNPVYYIQYAHARICSVLRQLEEKGYVWEPQQAEQNLHRLCEPHELALLKSLSRFPEVVETAAREYAPHQVAFFLRELANDFHVYYNAHTFLVEEGPLRNARLALIIATRQVVHNGLTLLGVSAPHTM
ncbi:MAG: arginine--tRNA ligase [Gammaproteobacteria bacterium]